MRMKSKIGDQMPSSLFRVWGREVYSWWRQHLTLLYRPWHSRRGVLKVKRLLKLNRNQLVCPPIYKLRLAKVRARSTTYSKQTCRPEDGHLLGWPVCSGLLTILIPWTRAAKVSCHDRERSQCLSDLCNLCVSLWTLIVPERLHLLT